MECAIICQRVVQEAQYNMGCQQSRFKGELNKQELIVATLNYCSIMNNPFEFYCQDYERQLSIINSIFESLLPIYFADYHQEHFKWNMGKIDVKIRTGRYSPLFSVDTGIQDQHFVTWERFSFIWDQAFDEVQKKIGEKFINQQRQSTKLFDFIAFHTLLIFVFQVRQFNQLVKLNPATYRKRLRPFFQLSFLDQKRKKDMIAKNFKNINIDILCVQEYSRQFQSFIDQMPEYIKAIDDSKDTMIIAKKESFQEVKYVDTILTKEERQGMNWAGKTAFLCLDNFIIINAHLTSKPAKNKPQIEQLKASIVKLKQRKPKYEIILAGDLNSFLPPSEELDFYFQMFPVDQRQFTTSKKRTMMQAQHHKGNKLVQQSKDKIITSLKLKNCKIIHINQTPPNKTGLLPEDNHPFDHYLVVATIYK